VRGNEVLVGGNEVLAREKKVLTRGNEVLTRGNEVLTRGNEVLTRGNEVFTRGNEVFTRGNEVFTRGIEVFTRGIEVFTRGNEVFTRGNEVLLREAVDPFGRTWTAKKDRGQAFDPSHRSSSRSLNHDGCASYVVIITMRGFVRQSAIHGHVQSLRRIVLLIDDLVTGERRRSRPAKAAARLDAFCTTLPIVSKCSAVLRSECVLPSSVYRSKCL
jgi:hypothetical protein